MINKKTIKKILTIFGGVSLIGWVFTGDDLGGTLMLLTSILIALGLHLMVEDNVVKAPVAKKKTLEEVMREKILAELDKQKEIDVPPSPPQEIPQPVPEQVVEEPEQTEELPVQQPIPPEALEGLTTAPEEKEAPKGAAKCPLCEKVCKNHHLLNMHLITKHKGKAKIEIVE